MTSIADLQHGTLRLRMRRWSAWAVRRGRRVLPEYEAERATWWALLRRGLLLAALTLTMMFYGMAAAILPVPYFVPAALPIVVLGLMVIWALPEALRPPLRGLAALFVFFTGVLVLWPNYLAISFAGLPWIALRRIFGAAAVLLLLVCASTSKKFRSDVAAILASSPWITRLVLGLIAVQVISTITSPSPGHALSRFLEVQIIWTGMFFIGVWAFGTGRITPTRWMNILLICALLLMLIGLAEARVQHVLWVGHIPSFLRIDEDAVQTALTPHFRGKYRVITTYTTPLSYAEFLGMVTPIILHRIVNNKSLWRIGFWVAADLLVLVSILLSGARLGMVSYLVAHVVYVLLWALRRWRTQPGSLLGIATTMLYPAAMVTLVVLIMTVDGIHNRVLGGGSSAASNDARRQQFELFLPAIAHRPFFGYGIGGGGPAIGWRNQQGMLSVDSGYMSIAADYGLIGFVCFFGAIVLSAAQSAISGLIAPGQRYPLRLAVATIFVVVLTTKSVLSQVDNNSLIFMFLGVTLALLHRARQEEGTQFSDLFRRRPSVPRLGKRLQTR